MWTFELYRILTAQRIAEMLREMDRERLGAQATAARAPRRAASSGEDRDEHPATFGSPARHTG